MFMVYANNKRNDVNTKGRPINNKETNKKQEQPDTTNYTERRPVVTTSWL